MGGKVMGEAQCGKIKEAIGLLAFEGEPISWNRYGSGHINDTFRLICKTGEGEKHYFLLTGTDPGPGRRSCQGDA